jgi:hypothetical protein
MDVVARLVDGGGAVALAVVIWWELRQFRKDMTAAVTSLAEKQAAVVHEVTDLKSRLRGNLGFVADR